jgi:hypothetical protein
MHVFSSIEIITSIYSLFREKMKTTMEGKFSPSQRRGAPFRALARGEGTNSARLFTPGEREALAKFKVHQ